MADIQYEAPQDLSAASALLAAGGGQARILAGGTDLLGQMKSDLIEPTLIIDIKNISETRTIAAENGGFRIGAAVRRKHLF